MVSFYFRLLSLASITLLTTSPLNATLGPAGADQDGDQLPDHYEQQIGTDPQNPADAYHDRDGDQLSNLQEFLAGTNPNQADSDQDGLPDGIDPQPRLRALAGNPLNERLLNLPVNRWHRISQDNDQRLHWRRQAHSEAVFDVHNARVLIFGMNIGGADTDNAIHVFDTRNETWSELYPSAGAASYLVDTDNILKAPNNRPPAMAVFASLAYDRLNNQFIIASSGQRNARVQVESGVNILSHALIWPTWVLDLDTQQWQTITLNGGQPPRFLTLATSFDSDRNVLIGVDNGTQNAGFAGTWELNLATQQWQKRNNTSFAIHSNLVYDNRHQVTLAFGAAGNPDHVMALAANQPWQQMPTPGLRPPGDQHVPLAFDETNAAMLAVVDEPDINQARTWAYHYASDSWRLLPKASWDQRLGTNYTMSYDPHHNLVWLVQGDSNTDSQPAVIHALRYAPELINNTAPQLTSNNLAVQAGDSVQLTVTATDAENNINTYQWQQITGPTVTLSDAAAMTANFIAPASTEPSQLEFRITVTDQAGASSQATIVVDVAAVIAVVPPEDGNNSSNDISNDMGNTAAEAQNDDHSSTGTEGSLLIDNPQNNIALTPVTDDSDQGTPAAPDSTPDTADSEEEPLSNPSSDSPAENEPNNDSSAPTAITATIAALDQPTAITVPAGSHDVLLNRLRLNAPTTGTASYRLQTIAIGADGSGHEITGIHAVKLLLDLNKDGIVDPTDLTIATSSYRADNGTISFTLPSPLQLRPNESMDLLVVYDFAQ